MQPGDPVEIPELQMTQDIDWSELGAPSLGAVHWRFGANELGSELAVIEAYNVTVEERLRLEPPQASPNEA